MAIKTVNADKKLYFQVSAFGCWFSNHNSRSPRTVCAPVPQSAYFVTSMAFVSTRKPIWGLVATFPSRGISMISVLFPQTYGADWQGPQCHFVTSELKPSGSIQPSGSEPLVELRCLARLVTSDGFGRTCPEVCRQVNIGIATCNTIKIDIWFILCSSILVASSLLDFFCW